MSDVLEAMAVLRKLREELTERSRQLADVSRTLEVVGEDYRKFVDDFEVGLWTRSQDEDGFKLPSEAMRLKLAHKAMDPALLGRYMGLTKSRERLMKRISDMRVEIDAQRSILSTEKELASP